MDFRQKIEKVLISFLSHDLYRIKSLGYIIHQEDKNVCIYKRNIFGKKILASFGETIIACGASSKKKIEYYPDIHSRYKKSINFNAKNFPGLIKDSKIDQCMLIPYMRNLGHGRFVKALRIVIITDKCQIFHNNPSRNREYEGESIYNDDLRFEESAIWDLPNRKYPSLDKNPEPCERYYPFLPDSAYEYHPALNTTPEFTDKYGNGGFGKTSVVIENGCPIDVCRFYIPNRNAISNPFHHIGGEESDYKMTLIGTYRPNNGGIGARTVVFATSDGGRNWYAKYEFGDFGSYEFAQGVADWRTGFGNRIISKTQINTKSEFSVSKRTIIPPSQVDKEPVACFKWNKPIDIEAFDISAGPLMITTSISHNLETGNVVTLLGPQNHPLCNNLVTENSGGNGILYKVKVIDDRNIQLYEYIHSPNNPICCRHIHQINRIKDGWIIGTGEIYPNSWLLYFQMKESDTYSTKYAWEEFDIFRLNSTENSVQRTLGAVLLDDNDQTLIFASDHDTSCRTNIAVPPQRTCRISRNSTGIFKGKLVDIDNRDKFNLIYESREPSFLFKNINNRLIFAGQRGELSISFNQGKDWNLYNIDTDTYDYHGTFLSMIVIGDYIVEFK